MAGPALSFGNGDWSPDYLLPCDVILLQVPLPHTTPSLLDSLVSRPHKEVSGPGSVRKECHQW